MVMSMKDKPRFKSVTKPWPLSDMLVLPRALVPSMTPSNQGPPMYSAEIVFQSWLNRATFGSSTATSRAIKLQLNVAPYLKMRYPSQWSVRSFWKWGQTIVWVPLIKQAIQQLQLHGVFLHAHFDSTTLRSNTGSVAALQLICWAPEDSPVWAKDLAKTSPEAVLLHPSVMAKDGREMAEWLGNMVNEHDTAFLKVKSC